MTKKIIVASFTSIVLGCIVIAFREPLRVILYLIVFGLTMFFSNFIPESDVAKVRALANSQQFIVDVHSVLNNPNWGVKTQPQESPYDIIFATSTLPRSIMQMHPGSVAMEKDCLILECARYGKYYGFVVCPPQMEPTGYIAKWHLSSWKKEEVSPGVWFFETNPK
jgi:hypothetical protein